jgi:speckle-type POZ protein
MLSPSSQISIHLVASIPRPMPMPSADSAASAIIAANQLTGRHVLHIEGYSHTKALVNEYRLVSQPFDVGGRAWCIWYYPHGTIYRQGIRDNPYISVYLVLGDGNPEPAYAEATFHVLGQAENPVPAHSRSTGLCRY